MWITGFNKRAFLVIRTNSNDIKNVVNATLKNNESYKLNFDSSIEITEDVFEKARMENLELEKINLRDCYKNICRLLFKMISDDLVLEPLTNSKVLNRIFEEVKQNYKYM